MIIRDLLVCEAFGIWYHFTDSAVDVDGRPFEPGFFTGSPMYHNLLFVSVFRQMYIHMYVLVCTYIHIEVLMF